MKLKNISLLLLTFGLITSIAGCKKDETPMDGREQAVALDKTVAQLEIDESVTVTASFDQGVTPARTYTWTVNDPEGVIAVDQQQGLSISVTAIQAGEAEIRYGSEDGTIYATCRVVVYGEEEGTIGIGEAPVFVAFGPNAAVDGWNSFIGDAQSAAGSSILDLIDADGAATGASITITEPFNGRNSDGVADAVLAFPIPSEVSSFSYFGNSGAEWQGKEIKQSTLVLSGLDAPKAYDFCFFGSRKGVGDNRETLYIVKGLDEQGAAINTSSNGSETACITGAQPAANGSFTIVVTAGPNNNNGNGFFYLSAMRVALGE